MCARNYLILFVDEDNNPLYEVPLQLTAKGCFQLEFDQKFCEFRKAITKAYDEKATYMKDSWYSICVFAPTFESMMRGEGSKQKKACITQSMRSLLKKTGCRFAYVYNLYCETRASCKAKGWWS